MSSPTISLNSTKKKHVPRSRPLSASEIARNVRNFETWSNHQGCEQASYTDIPQDIKEDVANVFGLSRRLPLSWVDPDSSGYELFVRTATPGLLEFIRSAHEQSPSLFCDNISRQDILRLYADVHTVFSAWRRLKWMQASKEKWSEHDFAANVYNVLRSPALRESTYRVHCTISLPQPIHRSNLEAQSARILNAKSAIPDCTVMIPAEKARSLSHSVRSPFKTLKNHPTVSASGSATRGSSFRFQSTPCAQLPDTPGFEFASSFWEDKKPVHQLLEDAYRQNRMSTAAAVRHLRSLRINAPVFGLVWANCTVRAHVDWCKNDNNGLAVLSAPFPGSEDENNATFHEWLLEHPGDILQVYFLIQNIDRWTVGKFLDRVTNGVNELVDAVKHNKAKYEPWRRCGDLGSGVLAKVNKENVNATPSATTASTSLSSPQAKRKGKRRH